MKTLRRALILFVAAGVAPPFAAAQREEVSETVGNSAITISYSNPSMKRGELWGERLPFGQNWTLGTEEKTTITFEEDVEVNGIRLGTGTYGFYVYLVNDDDWQLVFSEDATGDPQRYARADDLLRIATRPKDASRQKRLKMGIENVKVRGKSHQADLYLHWGKKKASLLIRMTGERRGMGLNPTIAETARPAWAIVNASLAGLIEEDFERHVEDFSDDFETDFGDGGGKGAHLQMLNSLSRGGLSEGMALNLEELEIEVEGDDATFSKIVVYSGLGTLDLSYELHRHGEDWKVTYLGFK